MNTDTAPNSQQGLSNESFERLVKEDLAKVIEYLNAEGEASRKAGRHLAIPAVPPWAKPAEPKLEAEG